MAMIAAVLCVAIAVAGVAIFNFLVRKRMLMREALAGIDVQLKRRHDLVPNIVEAVKGYAKFERTTLESVVTLRTRAAGADTLAQKAAYENELTQSIKQIFALVEAYPDLKASKQFLALQESLIAVEDEIQLARRYYNGTVRDYTIALETFPNNMVAGAFGFKKAEFFEIETATDRAVPEVKVDVQ